MMGTRNRFVNYVTLFGVVQLPLENPESMNFMNCPNNSPEKIKEKVIYKILQIKNFYSDFRNHSKKNSRNMLLKRGQYFSL